MNYFEFYDLPISFEVDAAQLKGKFYELSRAFHPDRFSLADEAAQEAALQNSVTNNQAFRTLNSFDLRMKYILDLKNLIGEEGRQAPLPQDFLMDMMDTNEAIMDLQMDFDADRFAAVKTEVEELMQNMLTDIQPVLSGYQDGSSTEQDLVLVRNYYFKKKYLLRILENLSTFARR